MAAEIRLSDGTTLKTEPNTSSDDVFKKLEAHVGVAGFVPITDEKGETYRVQHSHVVYVRDVP